MARLHLVGFTTDLKNLVFATRKGARSGTFLVSIDGRLRRTLTEVERLEAEEKDKKSAKAVEEKKPPPSQLTPKEIQKLIRSGKSSQEIAKLAETDVAWIERFAPPILAEMAGVVDAVRRATISKARLGPSGLRVGDAITSYLGERRVSLDPEEMDEAWRARKRNAHWEVSFRYVSRGQRKLANFAYDAETREVRPLNNTAIEIGWRPPNTRASRSKATTAARSKSKKPAPKRSRTRTQAKRRTKR
jgi:hypothetical protein